MTDHRPPDRYGYDAVARRQAAGETSDSTEVIAAMSAELGELPESVATYAERDPQLFASYTSFRSSILDHGVISRKDKVLMVVALLTAQRDHEPLALYSRIAKSEGASSAELKEAFRVGVLFSGGAGVAAAARMADLLEGP